MIVVAGRGRRLLHRLIAALSLLRLLLKFDGFVELTFALTAVVVMVDRMLATFVLGLGHALGCNAYGTADSGRIDWVDQPVDIGRIGLVDQVVFV